MPSESVLIKTDDGTYDSEVQLRVFPRPDEPLFDAKARKIIDALHSINDGNRYRLRSGDDFQLDTCAALLKVLDDPQARHPDDALHMANRFLFRFVGILAEAERYDPDSEIRRHLAEIHAQCTRRFPYVFGE